MRPSARYALVMGGLVVMVAGGLLWQQAPSPPPRAAHPLPLRPEGLDPVDSPIVGAPSAEQQVELLDRLEAMEAETLGPAEAQRRRAFRERELDARLSGARPR